MGSVNTVTISGNTYYIYGTRTDAVAYLTASVSSAATAFLAATTDQQDRALVSAARILDGEAWPGTPTVDGQPLAWPRTGVVVGGTAVDDTTVPDDIVNGEYELAALLVADPTVADQTSASAGVKSLKAGSAEVTYFAPGASARFAGPVQRLVGKYLSAASPVSNTTGAAGAKSFGRGDASQYDDCDRYDLQ